MYKTVKQTSELWRRQSDFYAGQHFASHTFFGWTLIYCVHTSQLRCVLWPNISYNHTFTPISRRNWQNLRILKTSSFISSPVHPPPLHWYFYLSTMVFTCPNDRWTGLCIRLCRQWQKWDRNLMTTGTVWCRLPATAYSRARGDSAWSGLYTGHTKGEYLEGA